MSQTIRNYTAINKSAPNSFDSLIASTYAEDTEPLTPLLAPTDLSILPLSITTSKITPGQLTEDQANSLIAAGITTLRYVDVLGNGNTDGVQLDAKCPTGMKPYINSIAGIDIPNRAFDMPSHAMTPAMAKNRGRGFAHQITTGDTVQFWKTGPGSENNIKVGADESSVLIALGVGNNCTLVGDDRIGIQGAPTYANVAKNEYSHYIALYDVTPATAKLITVRATRGDLPDEELAELSSQKTE